MPYGNSDECSEDCREFEVRDSGNPDAEIDRPESEIARVVMEVLDTSGFWQE